MTVIDVEALCVQLHECGTAMTKATFPINDRWRLSEDGECQWILQRANPKAKHDRNRWQPAFPR